MDLELVRWILFIARARTVRMPMPCCVARWLMLMLRWQLFTEPDSISHLLASAFAEEQRKDPDICSLLRFLEDQRLPEDPQRAKKIALQAPLFTICDNILYYIDPKPTHRKRIVVPKYLTKNLLEKTHRNRMAGHFSGQ